MRISKEWLRQAGLPFDQTQCIKGLRETRWPGRHQLFVDPRRPQQMWFIDGAHTVESLQYAAKWFQKHAQTRPNSKRVLLFHLSHDRSPSTLLPPLVELNKRLPFDWVYFVKPSSPASSPAPSSEDLSLHVQMAEFWNHYTNQMATPLLIKDLLQVIQQSSEPLMILGTGSLYLVGDLLRILNVPLR